MFQGVSKILTKLGVEGKIVAVTPAQPIPSSPASLTPHAHLQVFLTAETIPVLLIVDEYSTLVLLLVFKY